MAYSIEERIGVCNDERERDDEITCYDESVIPQDRSRHYDALIIVGTLFYIPTTVPGVLGDTSTRPPFDSGHA